jgi:hypothetical protein
MPTQHRRVAVGKRIPDAIVLIPGITGSELTKGNERIWGWSGKALLRNLLNDGAALDRDLFVMNDSPTAPVLDDGVQATRLLPDLHLLPGLWKVDGYSTVQDRLVDELELTPGINFFPFPYDWRRDNRAAAHRLRIQSEVWLHAWRKNSGNPNARLIIVAHSMGGLISRYFLEVLEGWRVTRSLITFGTPFMGSMNAVNTLANGGKTFGLDLERSSRSMNSMHQLLPTYPCCDTGDGKLKHLRELNLPGIDPLKASDAVRFHEEIDHAANKNQSDPLYKDLNCEVFPIVGYDQPTNSSLVFKNGGIEILKTIASRDFGGDGTVPAKSAVPEGFNLLRAMFSAAKHAQLQNHTAALNHVVGLVRAIEMQEAFRAGVRTAGQISLDVDDIQSTEEPMRIRAKPAQGGQRLWATVSARESPSQATRIELLQKEGEWMQGDIRMPHAGVFDVVVTGTQQTDSIRDVVEVVDLGLADGR